MFTIIDNHKSASSIDDETWEKSPRTTQIPPENSYYWQYLVGRSVLPYKLNTYETVLAKLRGKIFNLKL